MDLHLLLHESCLQGHLRSWHESLTLGLRKLHVDLELGLLLGQFFTSLALLLELMQGQRDSLLASSRVMVVAHGQTPIPTTLVVIMGRECIRPMVVELALLPWLVDR